MLVMGIETIEVGGVSFPATGGTVRVFRKDILALVLWHIVSFQKSAREPLVTLPSTPFPHQEKFTFLAIPLQTAAWTRIDMSFFLSRNSFLIYI